MLNYQFHDYEDRDYYNQFDTDELLNMIVIGRRYLPPYAIIRVIISLLRDIARSLRQQRGYYDSHR